MRRDKQNDHGKKNCWWFVVNVMDSFYGSSEGGRDRDVLFGRVSDGHYVSYIGKDLHIDTFI